MDQPLDDLQDGKRDGLAFYSAPRADRVDLSSGSTYTIPNYTIWVPKQFRLHLKKTVVHDHPLLKLYRDFRPKNKRPPCLREADIYDRIRGMLSNLIKNQKVSPDHIDDGTFDHPAFDEVSMFNRNDVAAIIEAKIKQYRSPKEMILSQYEVISSNLRHPHSIVRQVAWLLLCEAIEYHSLELRTAQVAADKASYCRQIIPKLLVLFEPLHQAFKDPDAGVCYHACGTLQKIVEQLMTVMDSATVQAEFQKFDYISLLKDRLLDPESDQMNLNLLNPILHDILLHKQIILASCSSIPRAELLYQGVRLMRLRRFASFEADPKFTEVYDYFKQADKPSNDDQLLWEILQTRYALYHLNSSSTKLDKLSAKSDYKGIYELFDDPYLRSPAAFTPVLIREFQQMIPRMQEKEGKKRLSLFMEEQRKQFKQKLLDKMQQVKQCWEQEKLKKLPQGDSVRKDSSAPTSVWLTDWAEAKKTADLPPGVTQQASSSAQNPKLIFDSEELARLHEHEFTQCKLETLYLESTQPLGSQQPGPSSGLATQSLWRATEEKRKVDPAESKDGEGSYVSQRSDRDSGALSSPPISPCTNKTPKKDSSPLEAMPPSPRRQNANEGESKWKVSQVETTPPSPSGQGGKKSCCIL